jgi:hypothetical protein
MEQLDPRRKVQLRKFQAAGGIIVLGSLLVTMIYGAAAAPTDHRVVAVVSAFLAAAAPFSLGVLAGFLFGIPKTLQEAPATNGKPSHRTQTNTNLEQISDWLTKILIGVGLTQLTVLPGKVQDTAEYLADAINSKSPGTGAVVTMILVYFAIAGFLWGYLVTRLILQPALDRIEPDPDLVERLINAKPPNSEGEALDKDDAAEILRFPMSELHTSDQLIAWGRATLEQDPNKALAALERACEQAPTDRRAVENLMFAALYVQPPASFERSISAGRRFLERPGRRDEAADADIYAYLACAYGQQHAWSVDHKAAAEVIKPIRDAAVAAAKRAVELGAYWKPALRNLMNPASPTGEDDLVSLKDDPELKALLAE